MGNDFLKEKGMFYRLGLVFLGLLSLFVLVKIVGEARAYRFIGSNPDVSSAISVSGKGEVFAVADTGTFNFSVVEEGKLAKDAQTKATEKINKAIDYLKKSGIDEKDIKTLSYNIYPKYEYSGASPCSGYYCPPQRSTIVGYEVSQTIEVKVRDTEKVGELLSGVGSLGVSDVSGLSFGIDDEEALKEEARSMAIEDARAQAEKLAKDLGVKIVRIISFSENSGGYPVYLEKAAYGMSGDSVPVAPEIPVGENKISSNVTITYEIR